MMIGESHLHYNTLTRNNPTAHDRSMWISVADPTAANITADISQTLPTEYKNINSPGSYHMRPSPLSVTDDAVLLTALCRYMESNQPVEELEETGIAIDCAYASTDEFRMYEFKVRPCTRAKAHDWTECPFAHPGEKARRRDPLRYSYSGTACTDFRKGSCRRGDTCEFAHGVFECWLHPTRYRTQACKDGSGCTRRVCFFAHAPDQLRVVSGQPSPRGVVPGPDPFEDLEASPPLTPVGRGYGSGTVGELVASLRNLQLNKVKSMPSGSGWGGHMGSPRFGSVGGSVVRPGFYSLPTTPTRPVGGGYFDTWLKEKEEEEEEPVMERVESGRELRARMFEKLSMENPLTLPDTVESGGSGLDVGWVTDLVR